MVFLKKYAYKFLYTTPTKDTNGCVTWPQPAPYKGIHVCPGMNAEMVKAGHSASEQMRTVVDF